MVVYFFIENIFNAIRSNVMDGFPYSIKNGTEILMNVIAIFSQDISFLLKTQ